MDKLLTQDTIDILYDLIKACFIMNRKLDRQVSVLGSQFAMNNTAKLCHLNIAHYFPSLSDKIGEQCLERYKKTVNLKLKTEKNGVFFQMRRFLVWNF